jgi:arylsulfatase
VTEKNDKDRNASIPNRRSILLGGTTLAAASALAASVPARVSQAQAQQPAQAPSGRKPNILVIFGDDIGQTNISAYSFGLMGYKTPNIDRIAREGMMFTDYYAEQSCTAGRSSFITGQATLRTGLSKVGLPAATVGLQARDATTAELLKPLGYATGQFGKNHLGDRNGYLPTVHGFDEFYGNFITSMPRRTRRTGSIRVTLASAKGSGHVVSCAARPPTATTRQSTRVGAALANRPSRIPAR